MKKVILILCLGVTLFAQTPKKEVLEARVAQLESMMITQGKVNKWLEGIVKEEQKTIQDLYNNQVTFSKQALDLLQEHNANADEIDALKYHLQNLKNTVDINSQMINLTRR